MSNVFIILAAFSLSNANHYVLEKGLADAAGYREKDYVSEPLEVSKMSGRATTAVAAALSPQSYYSTSDLTFNP